MIADAGQSTIGGEYASNKHGRGRGFAETYTFEGRKAFIRLDEAQSEGSGHK